MAERKSSRIHKTKEFHGKSHLAEYRIWAAMIERCENPNHKSYRRYGARGISVCARWRDSFQAFFNDMGPRPPRHTIERDNTNGHYEPSNCRWATRAEQSRNTSCNRLITHDGRTQCLADWALELGVPVTRIFDRLRDGRTVEEALTAPRSDGRLLAFRGKSMTITAWARDLGIDRAVIKDRLRLGWTVADALTKPIKKLRHEGLSFRGRTQTIVDWARETGISREAITKRLKYGWSIEKTLTTPARARCKS